MTNKFIEQRVKALENELSELKLIVAQIRKPSTVVKEALANDITAAQAEKLFEKQLIPKTPNQLRAEIIEKAKGFVERNSQGIHYDVPVIDSNLKPYITLAVHFGVSDELELIINNEKRTVVALIRTVTGKRLHHRGIAKCDPSDVFNEHIGKAIALGRALGLDVSEFEQAVQPSHYAIGQIGINQLGTNCPFEIIKIGVGEVFKKNFEPFTTSFGDTTKPLSFKSEHYKALTIINDTNARYGGVE